MQKKIGKKYNYFGAGPTVIRPHPELQWNVNYKIDQYKCIEQLFGLNSDLEQAKVKINFKEKKQSLAELEQKVREQEIKLNELRAGDYQQIKGSLKERGQIINPLKSSDQILEHFKCTLFDKRKALDVLHYEQDKFCKSYERRLKRLAEMRDRDRFKESCQSTDELKVKQLEFLLANSEIQIQSYINFLNDCANVINRLSEESLRYPNTLKYLEDEVNEQNGILDAMNKLGMPAYNDALKNKKRLEKMEKRMQYEASTRQASITSYKRNLLTNEQNISKLLPIDEHIQAQAPDRYIQETPAITNLRLHHEKVENETKELCNAAACANINDLFASVKDVFSKIRAGEEKVNSLEIDLNAMDDKIDSAQKMKDELSYCVTEKDIDVRRQTNNTNQTIGIDTQTRELVKTKIDYGARELFQIRFSLQHLVELLRNVNGERPMFRKGYPNEILSLPLVELHENYDDVTEPPETIEEDLDKLIEAVLNRIQGLMNEYSKIESSDDFWKKCQKRHQELVLEQFNDSSEI